MHIALTPSLVNSGKGEGLAKKRRNGKVVDCGESRADHSVSDPTWSDELRSATQCSNFTTRLFWQIASQAEVNNLDTGIEYNG